MRLLNNEKGYSLLLTLVLVLLFAVLGSSLIAVTINGAKKNETREHITQAQDLATKGIVKIENQVQHDLLKDIPDDGFSNLQFEIYFNNIISKYFCSTGTETIDEFDEKGDLKFETCIVKVIDLTDENGSKTKKELVFKSIGHKNSKESVVYETVEMGADDIQKVLNYTVSTIKNNEKGGNLFFHGGSEITGDMNIHGNIFSTNYGYGLGRWAESIFPKVKDSKINLGGNAYTFTSNPEPNKSITSSNARHNYTEHIERSLLTGYSVINNLKPNDPRIFAPGSSNAFSEDVEIIKPVNSADEVNKFKESIKHISGERNLNDYTTEKSFTINDNKNFLNGLTIHNKQNNNKKSIKFNKNIFIKGNLVIGDNGTNTYKETKIEGKTIYVEGDVIIRNVDLEANFTIFATGKISIQYVRISGIIEANGSETGSLIAFADKDFILSNLSESQNDPSIINGFFYSNSTMELYGFGSNTKIIGGVAANNIVLNAMRGYAKDNKNDWPRFKQERVCFIWCWYENVPYDYQQISTSYYELRSNQSSMNSRLQIIYDDELLETYRNSIDFTSRVILKDRIIDPIKKDRSYEAP